MFLGCLLGCLLGVFWMSFGCLLDFQMATIRGGSSLTDGNLNLHFVFTICWQQNGHIRVKHFFLHDFFFLLMVLQIPEPTKSKTQVSMAHVPPTKSRAQHLNREKHQVFGCLLDGLLDFQMATVSIKNLVFQPVVEKNGGNVMKCHHNTSKIEE